MGWSTFELTSGHFWVNKNSRFINAEYEDWRRERQGTRNKINIEEYRMDDEILYPVNLMNWDEYMEVRTEQMGEMRVEEELIQKTMNAEKITIDRLLLATQSETPAIEGSQQFIEGQLKYLE